MYKTKENYLETWKAVEKGGTIQYYKEIETKNHGNILLMYNNQSIVAFQKEDRLVDEQTVRKHRNQIKKMNICARKESGLPVFWEDAYSIFSSENFIELKKIVEG